LLAAVYLEDYPKQNVQFGRQAGVVPAPFDAITATDTTGCTFCASNKGAAVFTGEQQVRFLQNDGTQVAGRVGGIALQQVDTPAHVFFFGVVGATGLVSLVK
jgi:hypothetical protein